MDKNLEKELSNPYNSPKDYSIEYNPYDRSNKDFRTFLYYVGIPAWVFDICYRLSDIITN